MISYFKGYYYFQDLKRIQYKEREEISKIQDKKLKKILNHAFHNSKFFNDLFKKNNMLPTDIKSVSDLNKLPIIDKKTINNNLDDLLTVRDKTNLGAASTSGSTGSPFHIYLNSNEFLFRKAKHLRANTNLGQKIRDRWNAITAPHHYAELTFLQKTLNIYCPRPVSVFSDVSNQVLELSKMRPDVLDGYATSLYLLAKGVDQNGNPGISPRIIISSAEVLRKKHREYIEDIFQIPVYDQYSCVEFGRVSWECKKRVGYHIDSDNMILEFVDADGEEVSPGETGRIICTSLFNYSMPFIRYSIGDLGSPSKDDCDCGINLPLMNTIEGRQDSLIRLPDGQEMSPRALSVAMSMYKFYSKLHQFQIVQKTESLFKVYLSLNDEEIKKTTLRTELESHLSDLFLDRNIVFDIEFVEKIPLHKSGKFSYVISEL